MWVWNTFLMLQNLLNTNKYIAARKSNISLKIKKKEEKYN